MPELLLTQLQNKYILLTECEEYKIILEGRFSELQKYIKESQHACFRTWFAGKDD